MVRFALLPLAVVCAGDQSGEEVSCRLRGLPPGFRALVARGALPGFALFATFLQLIGDWRRHPQSCRIAAVGSG